MCEKTNKHVESAKYGSNELLNIGGIISVSAGSKGQVLPSEDQVLKQKLAGVWIIIQCLRFIELNSSFNFKNENAEKYYRIFPDPAIAKSYQQKAMKLGYVFQIGKAPFMQNMILKKLKDQPSTFDKTLAS